MISRLKENRDIKVVVVSGLLSSNTLKSIKDFNTEIKIIKDIHGTSKEHLEYGVKRTPILSRILYYYDRFLFKRSIKYIDGFLVASESLKQELLKMYNNIEKLEFFIVPCSIDRKEIDRKEYIRNRSKWRANLNIKDETSLFIYSGGVSEWQKIRESIENFNTLNNILPFDTKMLLMSHNIEKIKKDNIDIINKNIILKKFSADQVEEVLTAGDFSYMLRDDTKTNNVAFPNKFMEYMIAANKVITTPFVYDIAKIIDDDIGFIYNDNIKELESYIKLNYMVEPNYKKINNILKDLHFSNTLDEFANYVSKQNELK